MKILIIGQSFQQNNGGGITLSNLFYNFPNTSLFLAASYQSVIKSNPEFCSNAYVLGNDERYDFWPISFLSPKYKSGVYNFNKISNIEINIARNKNYSIPVIKIIYKLFHIFGFYNSIFRLKVSEQFLNWYDEIKPDIIYSQLSTYDLLNFINDLSTLRNFKSVIHIMDDWPKSLNKSILFRKYWDNKLNTKINYIFNYSSLHLSISQGMTEDYKVRYGLDFIPFHNPVDLSIWLPNKKTDWSFTEKFKILYTGRIGTANCKSIVKICKTISELNNKNSKIEIDIYTPDYLTPKAKKINKLQGVNLYKSVIHHEMPEIIASHDLLILPLDFDKSSIRFARLSMPTKVSEYLVSGTPILVFASKETFLLNFFKNNNLAIIVLEDNQIYLRNAILNIYNDLNLRKSLGVRAQEFAISNYDALKVRKEFQEIFYKLK